MGFISDIIGYPLGWVMYFFYNLIQDYSIAIILFTIVTKLIVLPMSISTQKSTAKTQALTPKLNKIKEKYPDNKEKQQEETMKLYEQEGANPAGSCLPMIIQMVFLYGVIEVVYNPLTHIFRTSSDMIAQLSELTKPYIESIGQTWNAYRAELFIMQTVREQPDLFSAFPEIVEKCGEFNNYLFGLNLGEVPQWGHLLMILPIISGVINILISIHSQWNMKRKNPEAANTMGNGMFLMMLGMPLLSVWIGFTLPAAVSFYWIISSITSFIQTLILNKVMTPEYVAKLNEKDKLKRKKKGRPSMYQRMLEQQQALQDGGVKTRPAEKLTAEDKLSRNQQKTLERQIINEARRRQAEKYGEVYDESNDD